MVLSDMYRSFRGCYASLTGRSMPERTFPPLSGRFPEPSGWVVVTFNYRVGFEGFGLLPGAPANRGLRDQIIDGDLVTGQPWVGVGRAAGVDLICGFMHEEYRLYGRPPVFDLPAVASAVGLGADAAGEYRGRVPRPHRCRPVRRAGVGCAVPDAVDLRQRRNPDGRPTARLPAAGISLYCPTRSASRGPPSRP
jgi:hypothetical protein